MSEDELNDLLESIYSDPDYGPSVVGSREFWKSMGISDEFIDENMTKVDNE